MKNLAKWTATARVVGAALLLGGMVGAVSASAEDDLAAGSGYGSDNLTFARWCSEIQKYPAERCASPSAQDQASYKATLEHLQAIEVEHQNKARQEQDFRHQVAGHDDPYRPPNSY